MAGGAKVCACTPRPLNPLTLTGCSQALDKRGRRSHRGPSLTEVFSTIILIFAIVLLGWQARRKGFMPPEFLGPDNRLVYYLAILAFIFRSISKASLASQVQGTTLFIALGAAAGAYAIAWSICLMRRMPAGRAGTFIQTAGHGNLGYVGLSIAF